jgi:hypothetical protein
MSGPHGGARPGSGRKRDPAEQKLRCRNVISTSISLPLSVLDVLDREVAKTGKSRSRIVVEAVKEKFGA